MYVYLIVALVAALVSGGGIWKVQDWRYGAQEAARVEAQREDKARAEKAGSQAGAGFEAQRTKIETKFVTVTETVEKIIDRPIYKNICIDEDGLKALNEAMQTKTELKP